MRVAPRASNSKLSVGLFARALPYKGVSDGPDERRTLRSLIGDERDIKPLKGQALKVKSVRGYSCRRRDPQMSSLIIL